MKKYLYSAVFWLSLITLLAGVLRLYKLGTYPVGFHIDEASLGYNGYSMLKTGKDEHGNRFPLYIDMFGDNRPSGYHYLTILPIAVLGLNEAATRLPGAIFGTLTVLSLYFLVMSLFKDKKFALVSSFLLAVAPWHIVSSRASAESIVALFFIISGTALLIKSLEKQDMRLLFGGSLSLTASFFFYHTPRVFVPLLLAGMFIFILKEKPALNRKFKIGGILSGIAVAMVSFLLVFVIKGGTGRFSQVNIFGSPLTRLVMEEQIREDGLKKSPAIVNRIYHNKIVNYLYTYTSNYLDYFSGKYLFISGGLPSWYIVPNMGLVYIVEIPFILLGLIYLFTGRNNFSKVVLLWLFLGPVVAAVTMDDIPNVQRSMVMFPMIEIAAAFGILKAGQLSKSWIRPAVTIAAAFALLFNIGYFLHQYTVHGAAHKQINRFNGFKEMVLAVKKVYGDYDHIIITKTSGGIYPHVLFFMQYDPVTYQREGSPKDPDFGGFGKFIFTPQFCPSITGDDRIPKNGKVLYVDSGTCAESSNIRGTYIYREDGTVAFIITAR